MKKLLIVLAVLMIPLAAQAQSETPVAAPAVASEGYLKSCTAKRDPRVSISSQNELCSCAATQMTESMSAADIQAMGQNNPAGRIALNKMLLDVYTPCMNIPVQATVEAECLTDPDAAKMPMKTALPQMCHCTARKTSMWFIANGRDALTQLLITNPAITDPVGPIMDSAAFKQAIHDSMTSCANAAP